MPPTVQFPAYEYGYPTSIPLPTLNPLTIFDPPAPPTVAFESLGTPEPLEMSISITPTNPFSATFGGLLPSVSGAISASNVITGVDGASGQISGLTGQATGLTGEIISYTNYLSGEISAMTFTDTFTLTAAPDWYAPYMPREMASVGWTLETIGTDTTRRYSAATWGTIGGLIVSMPIKLVLNIWELLRFFGPLGLFIIWLLIMVPVVLGFDVLGFITSRANDLFNFVVKFIHIVDFLLHWLVKIVTTVIEWIWRGVNWILDWIWKLWEAIPFLN